MMNILQRGNQKDAERQFDLLFRETYPRVLRYLEKISGQKEVAEDLAQNIYLRLWENKITLPAAEEEMFYYLFAIARNSFYQHTRNTLKEHSNLSSFTTIHFNEIAAPAERESSFAGMENLLTETLAGVEPLKTKFFLLNKEEGLTYRQIAEQEGVSVKTVMRYIGSVSKLLRSKITSFFF